MNPGAVLQEEYRRCLESAFRGGHAGACHDVSLKEWLWHHLLEDWELHRNLDGENTFPMLAAALRGHLDLKGALRDLGRAFEVLELAAVNLYFFPWRKEFSTIKTFSGIYVHVLQGVLPEADLARSFRQLGYVQRDHLHLVNSQMPPSTNLLWAACSFFAARVECEILGKIVEEMEPRVVPPDELLKARREARGSVEGCVARLRSLARGPRSRTIGAELPDRLDLYRESPQGQSPYCRPAGSQRSPLSEHSSLRGQRQEQRLWSRIPQQLAEDKSRLWVPGQEQPASNSILGSAGPDPEGPFSFVSLKRELSRTSEAEFAAPRVPLESPVLQSHGANEPTSPSARQPRSLQLSPASQPRTWGLGMAETAPYQMHSCLLPGSLPSSCCITCKLLHASSCYGVQICRNQHQVEELQSEQQRRLWLQRTEVDRLFQQGEGAGNRA